MTLQEGIKELLPSFLQESSTQLVCVLDFNGEIIQCNSVFRNFFKFDKVHNLSFFDSLDEDQRQIVEPTILELIGQPNDNFKFFQDYNSHSVSWEFSVLNNREGDFIGILGFGSVKNESNSIFEEIGSKVNAEVDIYFQINSNWEIQFANSKASKFFGTNPSAYLSKKIWQVFPDPKIFEFALQFKRAKETDTLTVIEDYISEAGNCYQIIIQPRKGWMDIYFKDVSDILLIENELDRLESMLQVLLSHSGQSYILMSQDLRVLRFNEQAQNQVKQYCGLQIQEGQKFLQYLLPGLEKTVQENLELIISGKHFVFEVAVGLAEFNEQRLFSHEFYPVFAKNGKVVGFVYANKDIHEQRAELTIIEDQNKVLREILYSQSVVLRSPLSSILGLLELLDKNQLDKENQKYLSYLKVLADEIDQIIRKNTKTINDSDSI